MDIIGEDWACIGNFNGNLSLKEQQDGRPFSLFHSFLVKFLDALEAMDIGFSGNTFTYLNNIYDDAIIKEMLNKVFCCSRCHIHWLMLLSPIIGFLF